MFKLKLLLLVLIAVVLAACSESGTEPESGNFSVSLGIDRTLPKLNIEGLELSNVKILVRSLKLTTNQGDSSNVKTGPFVMQLNLNGSVNTVAVADIPDNSYDKIKFEFHKPDSSVSPPDPAFKDEAGTYSAIISGVYEGEGFEYKCKKSAKQIIHLDDPVSLEEDGILNVTLIVDLNEWFIKKGEFLDPTNQQNESNIDNSIHESFKRAFRDNNRDGMPD